MPNTSRFDDAPSESASRGMVVSNEETLQPPSRPLPYEIPELVDGEIVLLPAALDGDFGIYPNEDSTLAKELRAAGVAARYLHDPEHRQWQVLMGEVPVDLAVGVASSVIGSGLWDTFLAFLETKFPSNDVHLRFVRQRRMPNGERTSTTLEVSGVGGRQLRKMLEAAVKESEDG